MKYTMNVYHGCINLKKGNEFILEANSDTQAKTKAVKIAKENSANHDDIDLKNLDTGRAYQKRSYHRADKAWQ